jgi:hypothetical protein
MKKYSADRENNPFPDANDENARLENGDARSNHLLSSLNSKPQSLAMEDHFPNLFLFFPD